MNLAADMGRHSGRATPSLHDHPYRQIEETTGRRSTYPLPIPVQTNPATSKDHFNKLMDAGAIRGFAAIIDPKVFGYPIALHLRINAKPGEVERIAQILDETPQVVEAHRVTGEGCFVASAYVPDMEEVQGLAARFEPFASTHVSVIQSTTVVRRLPKL